MLLKPFLLQLLFLPLLRIHKVLPDDVLVRQLVVTVIVVVGLIIRFLHVRALP